MGAKIAYYCFVLPMSYLPLWILYRFSDFFYCVTLIFPYRKQVVYGNLERSFPEKTPKEIKTLARQFYRHLGDILIEGVKNLSISKEELTKRFKVVNPEVMDELYHNHQSVLLVSGHYNNWEWLISSQNFLFPHQAMGIGMPLTSKFWDKKVNHRRQRFGMQVVHSKNFKERIANREKEVAILVLSDQSPPDSYKSFWLQFLHQTTAVLFGAELMAHEYNFPVIGFTTRKIKRGYYEMELKLLTSHPRDLKWGEITELHTRLLEQSVLENPSQWMWSHKRWKRELPEDLDKLKEEQKRRFNEKFNY